MLKETGAIIFDGAEALSYSAAQPETLLGLTRNPPFWIGEIG